MSIREIALALPLVAGIACSTTGSQSSEHTGAMWTERGSAVALMQGTGSQGQSQGTMSGSGSGSPGSSAPDSSASVPGKEGSGSADTPSSGGPSGSMGTGSAGSPGAAGEPSSPGSSRTQGQGEGGGSMGGPSHQGTPGGAIGGTSDQGQHGAAGSPADRPGTTNPGPDARGATAAPGDLAGHSDDQLVSGKVAKVSKGELRIAPQGGGEAKTLKIVKETVVTVNGKDAKPGQLKQGQQVRASYNQVEGQDTAVKIEVGRPAAAKKKAGGSR